ncbi:hypothetical protein Tco_0072043 [Tanacetum coccineum]
MTPRILNFLHQAQAYLYLQVLVINSLKLLLILHLLVLLRILQMQSYNCYYFTSSICLYHFTISSTTKIKTPILTPPVINDVPTVTIIVLELDALNVVQLRVANLEKDVSKLKKFDISTEAFAALKTHVPTDVDNYHKPQFTIKSTDTEDLKEFDLKRALYQHMHANKSFNRNPANHRLYHALMEALIKDENAMDKGVVDTLEDHKIKHDGDDDDDEEGPSTGLN